MFAGGMNMTARDYAELLILSTNRGVASDGTRVLTTASADRLMTSMVAHPTVGGYSYGRRLFGLDGSNSIASNGSFSHGGSHGARTLTFMCGNPSEDEGLVVLLNRGDINTAVGSPNRDVRGRALIQAIVSEYNAAVGWTNRCQGV